MDKKFIFITFEGMTFQPGSEEVMPDIENMQVIGFANVSDSNNAFNSLMKESPYLKDTTFDEIIGLELIDGKYNYFSINQEKTKVIN